MLLLFIALSSCFVKRDLPGIYQQYDDSGAGYHFKTLILNSDSTYHYLHYGDELCYAYLSSSCGTWTLEQDTLHLIPFDTIPFLISYLPDTSSILSLELYDIFGCQYFAPLTFFAPSTGFNLVGYGRYNGKMEERDKQIKLMFLEDLKTSLIEIKRDSMDIKVSGMKINAIPADRLSFYRKGNKIAYKQIVGNQHGTKTRIVCLTKKDYLEYFHLMYDQY